MVETKEILFKKIVLRNKYILKKNELSIKPPLNFKTVYYMLHKTYYIYIHTFVRRSPVIWIFNLFLKSAEFIFFVTTFSNFKTEIVL